MKRERGGAKKSPDLGEAAYTYADYCTWPDDERWEIIEGQAFDMSPAPSLLHQEISGNLFSQFHAFLEGKLCKVFSAPCDTLLPDSKRQEDGKVRNVVQPDILVVCDEQKRTDRFVRGAPDLAVEVLSPSTAGKDHIRKRRLYEQHGVKEFWLVHPVDRTVMVYSLDGEAYGPPAVYDDQGKIEVKTLAGLTIDCARVFPPQPKVVRQRPAVYHPYRE